jgi:hypothetical protein
VTWRKRNLLRKIWTQGKCGPRKRLTIAGRKTTHRATAILYEREENQLFRQEGFWTGVHKASKQDVQRFSENKKMDLMER